MISRRAAGLPLSSTATLDAHVKKLAAEGVDVINLTGGELDFPTPDVACRGGIDAITSGFTRYTAVSGIAPLRQAIAERLTEKWRCPYEGDDVVVTNGAKQALANAFAVLLDPGDEVILQAPHWVSFPHMISLAGGVPIVVETDAGTGFKFDRDAIVDRITVRTKALLINSPSNPTGVVYSRAELTALAELAAEYNLAIVSDEIYSDLVYGGVEFTSVASLGADTRSRTITVGGFSKTFAMTGWRVGFAAGPRPVIAAMSALQGHTTSAPSSISQRAALAALVDEPIQELADRKAELERRRRLTCDGLADLPGLRLAVEPEGAFFALVDVSGTYGRQHDGVEIKDAATFAERLLHEVQVAVMPGADFGVPDHIRISYAVGAAEITEAFRRIRAFLTT
ncbi:pyridoxal phosphate-dependent aminotransferase [Kutzneria sp. 744]|uniref:pyridoxal phosphate-dependent aminotransferase n=1 Tax=Kutzneria sp. (strain 744) TaxID=345341 RepID=UPI0003EEA95A|nr:pyridoxal phosphate-dependent aminotransferase [Kutzneria sp. 744]EWM19031.1 aspartate transaminase [Kutzneria sp. 744]